MKKIICVLSFLVLSSFVSYAQPAPTANPAAPKVAATADIFAKEIANAALAAHGGDKLKGMKTLILRGSMDTNVFNQAVPGTFAMVFSGEKYRIDLNNPFQPIKQVFNGTETLTLMPNSFKLPPLDRVGFYVLGRIGDPMYPINALPATSKRKYGFRITSPDGRATDFYVDEKTKQIKGYDASFDFSGQTGTTSVEIDKYRTVDGVLVPEKFAQRFDLGAITAYCDFKAKEILVNSDVLADVFTMDK